MTTSQLSNETIQVSAPGKVILHGEHSVVYNKLAIAASLGLRTRLQYTENVQNMVSINFPSLNLLHFYKLQDIQDLVATPLPLTKAPSAYNFTHPELVDHEKMLIAINSFVKEKSASSPLDSQQRVALTSFLYLFWAFLAPIDSKPIHFKLTINSELTLGAGTGSSASFAVTLVAFLMQYIRVKNCKSKSCYKSFKITNTNLKIFDKTELELISKWAFQSEKIIHGTPSGVDNTICTFGGLVEFRKGTAPKLVDLSTRFPMILINTKVSRDTKRLVANVAERREKYKMLIDGILEAMDIVTSKALDYMKKLNNGVGDHVEALDAYDSLGELADMNQNLLGCLGVSHPKLDEICLILRENGLHGKLTGAGGGGYAICLVPPRIYNNAIEKVIEQLTSRGFEAVLTDLGGCGVSVD